jgi:uncharacterized damage-inducible protein DinB
VYLKQGRLAKAQDWARARGLSADGEVSYLSEFEHLLYTMRHVQHHMAQLNLILRQVIDSAPNWVGRTKLPLIPEGSRRIDGDA